MKVFYAPEAIEDNGQKSIFLAGTIDMGNSENWQATTIQYFEESSVNILNPRRLSWDSSWKQEAENPEFKQQVNWELDALEKADIIMMNFLPTSQSPITLLELGLFAASGKLLVCCPRSFWRFGNVQIICQNYQIPHFEDFQSLLTSLGKHLLQTGKTT